MENEHDDLVYFVKDLSGSWTIAYKNNDLIHLVGDNKRLAYRCKYKNSDEMKWADRDKFRPMNSTPKMSFLHVLVVLQNALRLWQIVATNPLNIVQDNLRRQKKQPKSTGHTIEQLTLWQFVRSNYACI